MATMMEEMSLDVSAPGEVCEALGKAIDYYRMSNAELNSAWQDRSGDIWGKIARHLETARRKIEADVRAWHD